MTHPTAAITAYWNAAADRFDTEPDHGLRPPDTRAAWAERLASWLPDTPSDVLDVGCGTGSLAELAARAGHRVTGVDLAPRMVGAARAKLAAAGLPGRFLTGDAGSLPLGRVRKVSPAWRRPARSPKLFEQGGPPLAAPAE
ncbi:class I SAM-dependent methyltransferase, partial [Streptomyces sp. NPDC048182]|uniref:class I SAM-dependent methyltransferase n=1 Tax=Streptomyces sp. NPDC048182 TaxID=3365507 RepID=UPI003716E2F6